MDAEELPAGWAAATLAELGVWSSGGTPNKKRPEFHGGDIPWVLTGDLNDGPLNSTPNRITQAGLDGSSAKLFPKNTLLMAMYGATIGKLGVLKIEAATNQACAALLPSDANEGCLSFVYYYLLAKRKNFKKAGKGGAQPNISQTVIKEMSIPVAPLPEQQRIVEKIETLFAQLDKGEEAVREVQKLLTRYRQSVLKSAVTGQLTADWRADREGELEDGNHLLTRILEDRRENWIGRGKYKEPAAPDIEGLPELPNGWVWASLEALASNEPNSIVDGPFGSKLKTEHYRESGVRVIRLGNIGDGHFVDKMSFIAPEHAQELYRHAIRSGDLVIASLGEQLPKACIVPDSFGEGIVKADCIKFSPHSDFLNNTFILSWLNSLVLRSKVSGEIRGVGRPRLNLRNIRAFAVPLPSKREQDRIAEIVADAQAKISTLEEWCETELKRSASLRQSILKDAFAGRLVPQDPSDEPASELLARIAEARKEAGKSKKTTRPTADA